MVHMGAPFLQVPSLLCDPNHVPSPWQLQFFHLVNGYDKPRDGSRFGSTYIKIKMI